MKQTLILAVIVTAFVAGSASAQLTETYSTPGTTNFVVPAGVSEVTIKAWGAGGGGGRNGSKLGAAAGGGGFVQGTYSVSEGDDLILVVGGGGTAGTATGSGTGAGGGGGGRSAVSNSTATSLLVVAAGGGGGAGGDNNISFAAGQGIGGAGGGATGIAGGDGPSASTGGAGGTSSAGGAGGTGSLAGQAGSFLAGGDTGDPLGGAGGFGGGGTGGDVNGFAPGAGGGGSGYYGGGGGGTVSSGAGLASGGGGGSSYADPSGTDTSNTAGSGTSAGNNGDDDYVAGVGVGGANGAPGANGGDGLVIISYESAALLAQFSADVTEVLTDQDVVFTAVAGGGSGTITNYAWDFGGGLTTNGPSLVVVTNAYSTPGVYTVELTVTDSASDEASTTNVNYIRVWSPTVHVATSSPSPAFPYDSWATAATDFTNILSAVPAGIEILLTNDTYALTDELLLDQAVTIQSYGNGVTGGLANAALTVLDRGGSGSRVLTISDAAVVLDGLTITGGSDTDGAGVYMSAGLVRNAIIENNASSSSGGGGVYLEAGGSGMVSNCVIQSNSNVSSGGSRELGGGGVHADGGTVVNCQILDNTDTGYGAGVWAKNSATIRNNLIARNASGGRDGGGVYVRSGSPLIESCTIVSNSCQRNIGGLYDYQGNPTVRNCIIAFNTDANGAPQDLQSSPTASHTCSPDVADGVDGNTTGDPLLADLAGGDYRPTAASPCIDTGTNQTSWMTGATDLDGNDRILDGVVDIGAYELDVTAGPLTVGITADATEVLTPSNVVFTAAVSGGSGTFTDYAWDFGDGQTTNGATLGVVTNTYSTPGVYTVELTVTDDTAAQGSATNVNYIRVWSVNVFVATNSASPAFPYTTWATAAQDLESVAEPAPGGVTITVSNGTYATTDEIDVDSGITIQSYANGTVGGVSNAALTVIDRGGSGSRVFSLTHADAVLDGLTITGGSGGQGGGVYMTAGQVQHCIIEDNLAVDGGGGICIPGGGSGIVSNCVIQSNTDNGGGSREQAGGGVYAYGGTFVICTVVDNVSDGYGGGISCAGSAIIRNNLIARNAGGGRDGGGIYVRSGTPLIESCTVVSNSVLRNGGGIFRYQGTPTVNNCVAYFNSDSDGLTADIVGVTPSFTCSPDATGGTGNTTDDPLLADVAGGDYRPTAASPCIDTGTNQTSWMTGATDLDGTDRILDGVVDMGAYELDAASGPLTASFVADATEVLESSDVVFTAAFAGGSGTITDYAWDFGDGNTPNGASLAVVTNTYTTPGVYTVSLTVTDDAAAQGSATNINYIRVWAANIYVATSSASPTFPYTTWATAADELEGVAENAPDGVTITVSNGTYAATGDGIDVDSAITIQSYANGVVGGLDNAAVTVVDRGGSGSRVFSVSDGGAVIDGVTITGGAGTQGGGMYLAAGRVQNCIVEGNTAGNGGGGLHLPSGGSAIVSNCIIRANSNTTIANGESGGGVYAYSGVITHCQIVDNSSARYGGGIACSEVGTTIRNCLVARNSGVGGGWGGGGGIYVWNSGPVIESCTVVSNLVTTADKGGGISHRSGSATVRNCIVYFNTSAGTADDYSLATTYATYTCAPEASSGTGNITGDPLLADLAGGDYRLTTSSPCKNTGDDTAINWAQDLDGEARIRYGTVDIGAYEYKIAATTLFTIR